MPHIPVGSRPCHRAHRVWHRLSVWFSLHSDSLRWAASLSDSLQMLPFCPNMLSQCGEPIPASAPTSCGGTFDPTHSLFLPSFLCPTGFYVYLCVPFWWFRTPASSELVLCEICVWRCIPEAAVERGPLHPTCSSSILSLCFVLIKNNKNGPYSQQHSIHPCLA